MSKRRLVIIGVVIGLIIAAVFIAIFGSRPQPTAPTAPVTTATPTPHPDEPLVRQLATEFIPLWGTYSYLDFSNYQSRVVPLLTGEFAGKTFGEEQLPYRRRSLDRDKFAIETQLKKIDSITFSENQSTVRANVTETISSRDEPRSDNAVYIVTYTKNGSLWKVNNVVIEK